MNDLYKGIDISKWQGKVDFKAVKDSGVQFVMLRTGFGRFKGQEDPLFLENYKKAKAAGLYIGAYHYSYAKTPQEAKEEAALCLSLLKGLTFSFPIAFDMEERTVAELGKEKVSAIAKAFCDTLEQAGYYVCIYASKSWLQNSFTEEIFKKYDIWLAHWVAETNFQKPFGLWQYTSDGEVDGIGGRVDLDRAYKPYPEIMRQNGLNGFPKDTPTPPTPDFSAGKAVVLKNAPLYVSATAQKPTAKKSGTFYLYDGEKINGRYRVTNSTNRVGKRPAGANVTGYVNAADLR